ncbi:MAG TPA: crossover junction endodeoxyribonuclease RuvC [Myxococcota bacterium]|nr:crossover junction endodeoxyribonuclease RuvC [Myxococcota bacterium]
MDPGSQATGYGLIERVDGRVRHVRHGVLRPPTGADLAERLRFLHAGLLAIVQTEGPEVAVVERVFLAANPRSALVLGQARGAILASLAAGGVRVSELAARQVKKAVTGMGGADKAQMQTMVKRLLALDAPPPSDAADALALALTFAQAGPLAELAVGRGRARRRNGRRAMTALVTGRAR